MLAQLERLPGCSGAWVDRSGRRVILKARYGDAVPRLVASARALLAEFGYDATPVEEGKAQEALASFWKGEGWFRSDQTLRLSREEGRILRERWIEEVRRRADLSDEQAERLSRLIQERWDAAFQKVHPTGGPSARSERQKRFGQMLEEIVKGSAAFLTPAQSSAVREVIEEVRSKGPSAEGRSSGLP